MKLRSPLNKILNIDIKRYPAYKKYCEKYGAVFGAFKKQRGLKIKTYKSKRKMYRDFGVSRSEFNAAQTFFAVDTAGGVETTLSYKVINKKIHILDIETVKIDMSQPRATTEEERQQRIAPPMHASIHITKYTRGD